MPARKWSVRAGLTAATIAAVIAAFQWGRPGSTSHGPRDLMLLYVGADDCAPCRAWQDGEAAGFRASAQFAQVRYREVKSPTLLDVLKDEHWPEELRAFRDSLGGGAGVPLWLVIADQAIVERGSGPSQWHSTVLPKLKSLLR